MSSLNISSALPSASQQPSQHAVEAKVSENLVQSAPKATDFSERYSSPRGTVDPESGMYVLQIRDGESGDVKNQYPSKQVVRAYEQQASISQDAAPAVKSDAASGSVPAPAVSSSEPATPPSAPSVEAAAPKEAPAPTPTKSDVTA